MNESMNRSDILQEIKKSLNFIYGIRSDYIDDELLKTERCKGKLPLQSASLAVLDSGAR